MVRVWDHSLNSGSQKLNQRIRTIALLHLDRQRVRWLIQYDPLEYVLKGTGMRLCVCIKGELLCECVYIVKENGMRMCLC